MKTKEPLISIILKGFSIIAGLLALWCFIQAFVASSVVMGGVEFSQSATYLWLSGTLAGAGLSLWWMAEIIALLGRIAENTGRQTAPSAVSSTSARPTTSSVTKSRPASPAGTDDPPSYQL